MFERFTDNARRVVRVARQEADDLGHHHIGTEHLLLALMVPGGGLASTVLREAGMDVVRVRAEIARIETSGFAGLDAKDKAALEAIGIDVDAVRAKVEALFGADALRIDHDGSDEERGWRLGRRRWTGGRFTSRAKKVLELSLREALALKHNYIGTEHILLGLIRDGKGLAARILADAGVDLSDLRRRVLVTLDEAA